MSSNDPGHPRTMRFRTLNSVYEIDGLRIRRLGGENDPTPRQGEDGEWREFNSISTIEIGQAVLIIWRIVDGAAQGTHTSIVREID